LSIPEGAILRTNAFRGLAPNAEVANEPPIRPAVLGETLSVLILEAVPRHVLDLVALPNLQNQYTRGTSCEVSKGMPPVSKHYEPPRLRRRAIWTAVTLVLTAVENVVVPLPNQWVMLPMFFLVGVATSQFTDSAPFVATYLTKDFNRGVVIGLVASGGLTWLTALIAPQGAVIIFAYTVLFYAMSATLRTTFETTSFLFRETTERGVRLFQAFAACRLTYFAVVPIVALSSIPTNTTQTVLLVSVWLILMLPQLLFVRGLGLYSTNRPLVRYGLGDQNVATEIEILKSLERHPLTQSQLSSKVGVPWDKLEREVRDLQSRSILESDGRQWRLGRTYDALLQLLRRKGIDRKYKR